MKHRHKRYAEKEKLVELKKPKFEITSILINFIAISVLIGAYLFIVHNNLIPDYQTYAYWVVNVLVSYNILVASARSFVAPIVCIVVAGLILYIIYSYNGAYVSTNQNWQLLGLGVLGLFISMSQLL